MAESGNKREYDVIVIGAGVAGLFFTAFDDTKGRKLLLEKTGRPGQKLLMSGSGACNLTHGGSIKDYIDKYADKGKLIRSCLYRHNNLELMERIEELGLELIEREDGKVFPKSMRAGDVLKLLLDNSSDYEIRLNSEVVEVSDSYVMLGNEEKLSFKKLVIATGGASYPGTGSDGKFSDLMARDLGLDIIPLKPALSPVFVENYAFSEISGVSFNEVIASVGKTKVGGPLLFTHRGLSGPSMLHISQYLSPGDEMKINFLPDMSREEIIEKLKEGQKSSGKSASNYISQAFGLPKAFSDRIMGDAEKKLSQYSNKETEKLASMLSEMRFVVSGIGGWNDSMVTKGGVSLKEIDIKTMELKAHPGIFVIGEALDVNGDTGGYNIQFAYSSAMAVLDRIKE